ncbi:MAG: PorP/SprF family type IX secretion system membrane protein [Bacteroidetes bacterium]|nr:PorP/SprF family type IX secretion system membrane protein [Bacteroidota bacterium]
MRTASNRYFLCLVLVLCYATGFSQDMNYTQYFATPIYYNPAFTGLTPGLRARFDFRDQWPQLPVDFKSYYFSADIGDRNLPGAGGIGILVASDNPGLGMINNLTLGLTLSVRIPITSTLTSQLGIKAAMVQRRINWNDMVFSGQLDEKYGAIYSTSFIPPDASKRTVPDFAVGGILQYANPDGNVTGNMGVAIDHLFKPDVSFLSTQEARIPSKLVIHGDVVIATAPVSYSGSSHSNSDPLKINVGAIYQNQNAMNVFQVGLNLVKYNLYLGSWYRSTLTGPSPNNILAVLAGYRYAFAENMSVRFMYSYDIQVSGALQGTGGAHEISLVLDLESISLFRNSGGRGGYMMPNSRSRRNASYMECSDF